MYFWEIIQQVVKSSPKLATIKALREATGISLTESKMVVEILRGETKYNMHERRFVPVSR